MKTAPESHHLIVRRGSYIDADASERVTVEWILEQLRDGTLCIFSPKKVTSRMPLPHATHQDASEDQESAEPLCLTAASSA